MSYANTANRPNPVAALGALGVPAAFGAILIVGLAVKAVVDEPGNDIVGIFVPVEPVEPPPQPTPQPQTEPNTTQVSDPVTTNTPPTRPETPYIFTGGATGPVTPLPGPGDISGPLEPLSIPTPLPTFDPVSASPRGNPGGWITNDDYRSSWINRGYSGIASFTLMIDAGGRVTGCSITGSTGHSALDEATCRLLERRARFTPAKDSSGNAVSGSYRSSVRWTIPE